HPDFSKLEITNELLGRFFGSRLMQNIRQQKGLTYGIYSGLTPLLHDGIFVIRAQTSNQEVPIALQEIYEEIECLRTQPPSTIELENLRCYIAGRLMRSFDGPFALAERLKESLVFGLKYNYYQQALNTLNSISPEEISNMAYVYLNPADMIETVVSGDVDGYPTHGE
ncbi:MAG TPA: peptidase M16, partial [Bacteroidales bacterium]|nr:peptidase M16 [Bacteroidales bacterium]